MAMTNRVSLIQGPPGTGKTHTTAVLLHTNINYFNDGNLKVLATAPSNHAAQLLAKKFVEILFHAENWKTMPICVLQCDASRHENVSRFSDVVRKIADFNLNTVDDAIQNERVFIVGPEDESTCKAVVNEVDPGYKSWVAFVNSSFRMLETRARVFFTTCSGAATLHKCQSRGLLFSLVVVDEAGKATQPDSFVATSLLTNVTDATRIVFVGDHKQLRPHIATKGYEDTYLGKSLMERLYELWFPRTMLTVQHRMHPNIRHVVSSISYDGRLTDAESVLIRESPSCINQQEIVKFIDCRGCQKRDGTSYINEMEVTEVIRLLTRFTSQPDLTIAVLSPYNLQVRRIQEQFELRFPRCKIVNFLSIDASQGSDFDIVVLSLVRSSGSLAFLEKRQRFNVAISRAKRQLVVVGNKLCVIRVPVVEEFIGCLSRVECLESHNTQEGTNQRSRIGILKSCVFKPWQSCLTNEATDTQ